MKKKMFLAAVCLCFACPALAAAGVGVEAGTSQSTTTEQTDALNRQKELSATNERTQVIQFPATTIIAQSILDDGIMRSPDKAIKYLAVLLSIDKHSVARNTAYNVSQIEFVYVNKKEKSNYDDMKKYNELPLTKKTLGVIAFSYGQSPFWAGYCDMITEARIRAYLVKTSIGIFEYIADEFEGRIFTSKDELKKEIAEFYFSIPGDKLTALLEKNKILLDLDANVPITIDTATGRDVNFFVGGEGYSFGAAGVSVAGVGGHLWGDGWLNGRQTMLSMGRSSAAKITKSRDLGDKDGQSSANSTGAEVNVK